MLVQYSTSTAERSTAHLPIPFEKTTFLYEVSGHAMTCMQSHLAIDSIEIACRADMALRCTAAHRSCIAMLCSPSNPEPSDSVVHGRVVF